MKKGIVVFLCLLFLHSTAFALVSYYDNTGGYDNTQGYNNQIPYQAFFNGHSPAQEEKKIQVQVNGRVKQGVVNVNTPEEKIEQQTIKD